jgi:hypothetical protein
MTELELLDRLTAAVAHVATVDPELAARIVDVALTTDFGVATARKTGRDRRWPYVPVIRTTDADTSRTHVSQILKRAYETREEAIAYGEQRILAARENLAYRLAGYRYRSLRGQYGLPRELSRDVLELERANEGESR